MESLPILKGMSSQRHPLLATGVLCLLALLPAGAAPSPVSAPAKVQKPAAQAGSAQPVGQAGAAPLPAEESLVAFSKVEALWGRGVEAAIETAYRECFRTFIIGGKVLTLRIPFGQNNERSELASGELEVSGGGKADAGLLWTEIEALLGSADFAAYAAALAEDREKAIAFDLEARTWSTSRDLFLLARLKAGAYPGLPHKPVVFQAGGGIDEAAVYDYLYSVGRLGLDCSGFVWQGLKTIAKQGGLDLEKALRKQAGAPSVSSAPLYVGTWFFHPSNRYLQEVKDEIRNLRPGDVIIFRDDKGAPVHSALIQSVDLEAGRIRYLQSTDEAPRSQRGVHESFIVFDPARPETSLKDPSLSWTQLRLPAFAGEPPSPFRDDGERYRAFPEQGGGAVVRLKALKPAIDRLASNSGR